jgi:hypothetical protein
LFPSLHLWDLCALIAASRGWSAAAHGRIVALAHGLPRVSLMPPQQEGRPGKVAAFAETWEPDAVPRSVAVGEVEPALMQALAVPAGVLRENARQACALSPQPGAVGRLCRRHELGPASRSCAIIQKL